MRTLKTLAPGRLTWFDCHLDWRGKDVMDLGFAGGFMALALADRGARVTGIDPAARTIDVARSQAQRQDVPIRFDVGCSRTASRP